MGELLVAARAGLASKSRGTWIIDSLSGSLGFLDWITASGLARMPDLVVGFVGMQGQVSRLVVRGIVALATQRPALSEALRKPGAFLDIGTGAGWLALEAARSWPALRVVGIDPWEPALASKLLKLTGWLLS